MARHDYFIVGAKVEYKKKSIKDTKNNMCTSDDFLSTKDLWLMLKMKTSCKRHKKKTHKLTGLEISKLLSNTDKVTKSCCRKS